MLVCCSRPIYPVAPCLRLRFPRRYHHFHETSSTKIPSKEHRVFKKRGDQRARWKTSVDSQSRQSSRLAYAGRYRLWQITENEANSGRRMART